MCSFIGTKQRKLTFENQELQYMCYGHALHRFTESEIEAAEERKKKMGFGKNVKETFIVINNATSL